MSFFLRLSFLLCHLLLVASVHTDPLNISVQAESAILINADTGNILFEKNAHVEQYPASITKVATALWTLKLQGTKLNQNVEASHESLASLTEEAKRKNHYATTPWLLVPGATHMGLKKGEILTLKDLLNGLLIVSANDAANVIAQHVGGTIPHFLKGMNLYMESIGCTKTRFENPSGLYHPDQKTCAYDMALIMREALQYPEFKDIISTVNYTRPKTNKQAASTLIQSNRLIRPGPFYYPKAIGGKTGYIAAASNTFVVAAKDDERTLIAVFLKTKDRVDLWKDSIKVFDAAFNQEKIEKTYLRKGIQNVVLEDETFQKPLTAFIEEDVAFSFYPAEEPQVKALVYWDIVQAPIHQGQKVGEIHLEDSYGRIYKSSPLLAAESVNPTWSHTLHLFYMTGSLPLILLKWALSVATLLGLLYLAIPKQR